MTPKLIKTEADYTDALARIDELFDAKPDTLEGDELDLLVTLVEMYEKREFPIDLPDPIEAIRFRMEQQGLRAKDLIPYIGSARQRRKG
jgi:HTH-type transcriptional regulator/antitoxin HigA